MAHFAKLDTDNNVVDVVVVNNEVLKDSSGNERESLGASFLSTLFDGHTNWRQTSYNGTFRKNYAGIGYKYDHQLDAFIPPKPFRSWVLDAESCQWVSPVPYPNDGQFYLWDEDTTSWIPIVDSN